MKHRSESIELIRADAQERGGQKKLDTESRVRAMMLTITSEIKKADGIYPGNKGDLSHAEFSRRVGMHVTTLRKTHPALLEEVNEWRKPLNNEVAPAEASDDPDDPGPQRRTQRERLGFYRERTHLLRSAQQLVELELQEATSKMEAAEQRAEKAEAENRRLRQLLESSAADKVVQLAPRSSQRKPK